MPEDDKSKVVTTPVDERQAWIERHVRTSFKLVDKDLKKLVESDDYKYVCLVHVMYLKGQDSHVHRKSLQVFMETLDTRTLFFYYADSAPNTLSLSLNPPGITQKKIFFVLKTSKTKITQENIANVCVFGDIDSQPLQSLDLLARDIVLPVINEREKDTKVRSFFGKFLSKIFITIGQTEGRTLLPLPLDPPTETEEDQAETDQAKDRIHTLETALVTWTNQIKDVLKDDPESLFKTIQHPGPLDEVSFWKRKLKDLVSIRKQLQSNQIQTILITLRNTNSTYIPAFEKLMKDVDDAIYEAEQTDKYLVPLVQYFEKLQWEST